MNTAFPSFARSALNPDLVWALESRLGRVRLVNQGTAAQTYPYWDAHRQRFWLRCPDWGETYAVSCPFCNDTRQRLSLCHLWGAKDPMTGDDMLHLVKCHNDNCVSDRDRQKELHKMLFGFVNAAQRVTVIRQGVHRPSGLAYAADPPGRLTSFKKWKNDQPDHEAVRYLIGQRGYTDPMLEKYDVKYCVEAHDRYRAAQGRIIFPVFFDGRVVGWQARYPGEVDFKSLGVPKYYTAPGFHKSFVLYNYDTARHKDFVVVSEGVTDVHAVGDHGVALLGKSISQQQRSLLLGIGEGKPIIFLLDPDAYAAAEDMLTSLLIAPGQHPVFAVRLPTGYDPGSYMQCRERLWANITAEASRRGITIRFTS